MSHSIKWGLFTLVPVIAGTIIYALWAEELNLTMPKIIISVLILESIVWFWAFLGRTHSEDSPNENNTNGCS